jgi:hypothetical protein
MNGRDLRAWADAIDERPSYGSRTGGHINYMGRPVERRSALWKANARRRRYQLRQMRARMEMEELCEP